MTVCGNCAAIAPNQSGAPGHAGLISLGLVRASHLAARGVTHEAFTCADCGANWDYFHDKRDPASGWTRCDRTTPSQAPIPASDPVDEAGRAA